jgi:hypothetical protein
MEQIERRTGTKLAEKTTIGKRPVGSRLNETERPQRHRTSHTLRDCQSWTPLVPEDVKADAAVRVDVGVVDARGKVDLGRLEGVVCGEVDC